MYTYVIGSQTQVYMVNRKMFKTFYLDIKMQMCTMSHPSLNHDYQNSLTTTCDVAYYLIVA
jgi:hypothetical protein